MESPYDLYRKMNSQYFSDTVVSYKVELTEELFRYEMDKLSDNMKQDLFENFVASLALRFITPNIVPQTGPTGGGDGKTDLETHPVADKIAEKWYIADGGCKGPEKWAFAISCKKNWKEKIRKDVDKIVKLERGFTKIFFFSNRQIRSADRKAVEMNLKKDYGLEVHILDQNWFVSRVFEDKCIDIAVKELGLSKLYVEERETGPNDLIRQKRLAEVEEIIANNVSEDCLDTEYVDLVIESAFLSRALEHSPRVIRGKFKRAEDISKQYGTKQQLFKVIYERGLTEFHWLKSPDRTYQCYLKLKAMLEDDVNIERIESIFNLYYLIFSARGSSHLANIVDIKVEESFYNNLYQSLKDKNEYWSSSLFLKICILELRIIQMIKNKDALKDLLAQLAGALDEATGFINIPFETHCVIIELISRVVPENEELEILVDHLSDVLLNRQYEIDVARKHLDRGLFQYKQGNYVKAIRHLGQCVYLFGKEQTKTEYVESCMYMGEAYMGMDLPYASKVMFMKAVSMLLHKFEMTGSTERLLVTLLSRLCCVSLRSGQIVNFLMAYERWKIFERLSPMYQDQHSEKESERDERRLATRLLSENVENEHYSKLPAILQRLGMVIPVDILFYKLGYPDNYSKFFKQYLHERPDWEDKMRDFIYNPFFLYANAISDNKTRLESLIRGCRFIVSFDSNRVLQIYSELLLAFMESFVSTTYSDEITITTSHIHFDVIRITEGKTEIIKGESTNEYIFKVNSGTIDNKEAWDAYLSYLSLFCTQNTQSNNMRELLDIKQKKEKMFHRLYVMMYYEEDVKALYGDDYKNTIEKWTSPDDDCYPFQGKEDHAAPFEKERGK